MRGAQLLAARVEKGWTQHQSCAALRVSQPYLSLMEKGLRPVAKGVASRAIKVYKLGVEFMTLQERYLSE